jgi:hypothetical protein
MHEKTLTQQGKQACVPWLKSVWSQTEWKRENIDTHMRERERGGHGVSYELLSPVSFFECLAMVVFERLESFVILWIRDSTLLTFIWDWSFLCNFSCHCHIIVVLLFEGLN